MEPENLLNHKKHFEILDGLRGVAAISVVTFHFMEMVNGDYSKSFIGNGFLAVDFFFCLSGFVIGYAYDDKIGQLGVWGFFKIRLIRLHPLVVLGSVLGLIFYLVDPFPGQLASYHVGSILLIFAASLLMIPFPVMRERGFCLFSFNSPGWSLFWEYIANICYVLILRRLNRRWLVVVAVMAGIGICYVTFIDGNIMGGWNNLTFWDGGLRITYSFCAGLLIYRSKWIIRSNISFGFMAVMLLLAFIIPFSTWNWLTEPFVIIFYFPLLIILGAGATLKEATKKICRFLGNISYPLYMTHYGVVWIFGQYRYTHELSALQLGIIIALCLVLLIIVAWLAMILYDSPIRKYLLAKTKKALMRQGKLN